LEEVALVVNQALHEELLVQIRFYQQAIQQTLFYSMRLVVAVVLHVMAVVVEEVVVLVAVVLVKKQEILRAPQQVQALQDKDLLEEMELEI
jgi:hypothetical protein